MAEDIHHFCASDPGNPFPSLSRPVLKFTSIQSSTSTPNESTFFSLFINLLSKSLCPLVIVNNMFDPGDVFAFDSSGIPWLIWIQLVVLFLLIALLYCFTVFALDSSDDASTIAATEGPTTTESASTSRLLFDDIRPADKPSAAVKHDSAATTFVINRRQNTPGGENRSIKGEVSAGTTRRTVSGEEFAEREGSSSFHPCHFFQLARVAFLKCMGLDPTSDSPPTQKRRKPKRS
ncbi:uncharacterized protein LOC129298969 [Prosopis cineraria]|uniref:uncharacterized protein LOC129298969 n=1 Tax=Prosopis cineraria TaxID=364024 RepID=UPI002410847C|nr:uncharacterized protein LOC129298969 [Prosopis cineraria]